MITRIKSQRRALPHDHYLHLDCENLEPRIMLSTIQLIAGGFEGTEEMQLQIDQVPVETWILNDTGEQGQFDTVTYESPDTIVADQVRIEFLNDQWDPANGIDSNIRLDAIVIDGVRFETEDPSVFSTGTWIPGVGNEPGFQESEYLHTFGYFQFAGGGNPGTGAVVINELHYNPGPGLDGDAEFLELYNPGNSDVDLSGMSFTGFDLTFADGTTLGAGQYAIVSPSIPIAEATWGVTPIAQFASGGISGGGEQIQLLAADGVTIVDEVTYDDVAPWPSEPDGNGPSLELIDADSDNALPTSWAASLADPTPAALNSVSGDPIPGSVVINEIHYNPGPDGEVDPDAEFIELYNPGSTEVDLSGMSFVGFNLTFADGITLSAGQYAIVGPSISIAEAQWGVTPIAEFASGGISGGGELIQLIAADGVTVVDEVDYDDNAPWPGAPDGNGPSLELIDPLSDNALVASWGVSNGDPTPAAQNSIFGDPGGGQLDITVTPGQPLPSEPITVSAVIPDATTATLTYKIGFNGADIPLVMTNVSGDVWEATIPGQSAGELVRYRIDSDAGVAPFAGDTINYFGVVVQATDIVDNNLPLFQFFVDDAQFEELTTTELALTNTKIPVVIAFNGQVYDNATVRVRGGDFSRLNFPKKSLKFELPDGYTIDFGSGYGIDEFGVNADYSDWTFAATQIAWEVWNEQTVSQTNSFTMRVENNADFHGVFRFQELYDGAWRDFNGHADDEFFKADAGGFGINPEFDKKSPDDDDFTSIGIINDALFWLPFGSEAQAAWLYENVDIPSVINHMTLSALTRHDDQPDQNFYMAQNTETGLWTVIEWDLDRLWIDNEDTPTDFTDVSYIEAELMDAVFAVPEFEQMYWRRMQTIVDTYLTPEAQEELRARREELIEEIGPTNSTLEFDKWGRVDIYTSDYFREEWAAVLEARQTAFANEPRMPGTASGNTPIVINELHYNPAGDDAEFIELYNNSSESIDLSGWTIDGIDLTIGFGTVILPGQYLVFTDNMAQFRGQYPGNIFVGGQYPGGLSGGGETVTLSDSDGNVVDQVTYDDADPWPTEPDGNGSTLSLIDPDLDNNVASSWEASVQFNGTPAQDNATTYDTYEVKILAAGSTGSEIITLELAGQEVAVFDLTAFGGQPDDLATRNFAELVYVSTVPVVADDVRITFLNDIPDPTGADRDVGIDRIEIDGLRYETEAPEVFSTGTWSNGGVTPGFLQTEVLNVAGYFQYAGDGTPPQPGVTVLAAGQTGNEIITLEVAGQVVATWELSQFGGQPGDLAANNFIELVWETNQPIAASDVRINFINDVYDPDNGIDYNVGIDRIEIDGVFFETEAPTVYSTGTWISGVGIQPGYWQTEVLHANGYFEYDSQQS